VIADPGEALKAALIRELACPVTTDRGLKGVPWGPHVYVPGRKQAWHVLHSSPENTAWSDRMALAAKKIKGLRLGVAAPLDVLSDPVVLEAADVLQCSILPVEEDGDDYKAVPGFRASIADVVYEHRLILDPKLAKRVLDRALERALQNRDSYKKGALLELVVAVMLSQVKGFEVTDLNISSTNQEIDVHVTNRNSSGPLGRGPFVLAEAKNWKEPIPRKEYDAFAKKLRTRKGMAKLGVFVTTGTFEKGVYVETIRDSEKDDVIVLLNKKSLPQVWRDHPDITRGLEAAVKVAVYDHVDGQ
jgi:hypothetical protein